MNEKLKQEIERYCGPYKERPVPDFMEAVAEHFYNLALQDVKKEIEDTALHIACPGYSSISACRDFIKFIDGLTK